MPARFSTRRSADQDPLAQIYHRLAPLSRARSNPPALAASRLTYSHTGNRGLWYRLPTAS